MNVVGALRMLMPIPTPMLMLIEAPPPQFTLHFDPNHDFHL